MSHISTHLALQEAVSRAANPTSGARDNHCSNALIRAARNGNMDCVQLLIGLGADLGVNDQFGNTALMRAARNRKAASCF